jgi:1,4-dihydroxy-2-naphthoate octaprenyltransferase
MNKEVSVFGPMRVPFLILTPACVLLGLGAAVWTTGKVNFFHFALVLLGAVGAHVSVNAFNEYFDYRSGLDFKTTRTPFSGGSGTLIADPRMARSALAIAWTSFAITALIGIYFTTLLGWVLLPLGILGLILIYTYTNWLTRYPLICLVAPGLGFGLLMVMGTSVALTGGYDWTAFIVSLVPFFLVSNLLLLNQFPDVEADQSIGRKHLPIAIGRRKSSLIYAGFNLMTFLTIILGVILGHLPPMALLGLLTILIAVPVSISVIRHAEDLEKLIPLMGLNVILNIATPTLVAIGLLVG